MTTIISFSRKEMYMKNIKKNIAHGAALYVTE